jgi:agmatine deiminase
MSDVTNESAARGEAALPKGMLRPTPKQLGFRMPAEWEPHDATWLTWPTDPDNWPGCWEEMLPSWWAMVRELAVGERVEILAPLEAIDDVAHRAELAGLGGLVRGGRVRIHEVPSDDAWTRDTGPIFLVGEVNGCDAAGQAVDDATEALGCDALPNPLAAPCIAATEWRFNAWGGKYPHANDAQINAAIAEQVGCRRFAFPFVLEGGSIDTDGRGTLLTTEACLFTPTRNPQLDRPAIETMLREGLGVERIVWLGDGILGDDTDGHVDDITRFVDPHTIVTVVEHNESDQNHALLRENRERLEGLCATDGMPYRIVELPMPEPLEFTHPATGERRRLPASHANFYIGNEAVVVPTFGGESDRVALDILAPLFPGRRVVGIDARLVVVGLGAFHCMTQQQPSVPPVGRKWPG